MDIDEKMFPALTSTHLNTSFIPCDKAFTTLGSKVHQLNMFPCSSICDHCEEMLDTEPREDIVSVRGTKLFYHEQCLNSRYGDRLEGKTIFHSTGWDSTCDTRPNSLRYPLGDNVPFLIDSDTKEYRHLSTHGQGYGAYPISCDLYPGIGHWGLVADSPLTSDEEESSEE